MNNHIKSNTWYAYVLSVVLLNAVMLIVSMMYGFERPIVNLDYCLLIVFCYYKHIINTLLAMTVLALAIFVDIFLVVLQIYPFIQLNDFLYLSGFVLNGPVLYQILTLLVVGYMLITTFLIKDFLLKRRAISTKQALIACSIACITWLLSLATYLPKYITHQSAFFVKNYHANMLQINQLGAIGELTMPYASKPLWDAVHQKQLQSDKILFIINESWGETATPNQQQAILQPIYRYQDRLAFIKQGHITAIGGTVTGEVRELCQKRLMVMDTKGIPAHEFANCLPNLLKGAGGVTLPILFMVAIKACIRQSIGILWQDWTTAIFMKICQKAVNAKALMHAVMSN